MFREDETHTLWLFEYEEFETAIRRLGRSDSSVNVTLFGILFELKGADELPAWHQQSSASAPTPPFNLSSLEILSRLSDYRMSVKGSCILLTTFIETQALKQAVNQQTSAEFHAGLYNNAIARDDPVAKLAVEMDAPMELAKRWEAMAFGTHGGDHDEHSVVDVWEARLKWRPARTTAPALVRPAMPRAWVSPDRMSSA